MVNYDQIIGGADGPTAVFVASQVGGSILLILVGVIVHVVFAFLFRNAARMKGHPMWRYFALCPLFGLPAWVLVAALPDRSIAQNPADCKRDAGDL